MVIYKQGDIIVMDFNFQQGHKQSERRTALILSNDKMIEKHLENSPDAFFIKNPPLTFPLGQGLY